MRKQLSTRKYKIQYMHMVIGTQEYCCCSLFISTAINSRTAQAPAKRSFGQSIPYTCKCSTTWDEEEGTWHKLSRLAGSWSEAMALTAWRRGTPLLPPLSSTWRECLPPMLYLGYHLWLQGLPKLHRSSITIPEHLLLSIGQLCQH
jgi:hypothetical protein